MDPFRVWLLKQINIKNKRDPLLHIEVKNIIIPIRLSEYITLQKIYIEELERKQDDIYKEVLKEYDQRTEIPIICSTCEYYNTCKFPKSKDCTHWVNELPAFAKKGTVFDNGRGTWIFSGEIWVKLDDLIEKWNSDKGD